MLIMSLSCALIILCTESLDDLLKVQIMSVSSPRIWKAAHLLTESSELLKLHYISVDVLWGAGELLNATDSSSVQDITWQTLPAHKDLPLTPGSLKHTANSRGCRIVFATAATATLVTAYDLRGIKNCYYVLHGSALHTDLQENTFCKALIPFIST